jgi:uncharacterized protein YggE
VTDQDHVANESVSPRRQQSHLSPWVAVVLVALIVAGAALGGVALGQPSSPHASGRITVTGTASIRGVPDTASFQIGVDTVGRTVAIATRANNLRTKAIENGMEKVGVKSSTMQTVNLSIYDNYNSSGQISSFTVNDTLTVTVTGITLAEKAITAGTKIAGSGLQFYGVTFSISNVTALRQQARSEAAQNAHHAATQIASAAGATVGSVLKITEGTPTPQHVIIPWNDFAGAANYSAVKAIVPLKAGHQSVSATVTITYALD